MARQKHDLGEIKKKTGRTRKDKEVVWRDRRKRSLPWLYPGWSEDKRPLSVVIAELRRKRERDQAKGIAETNVAAPVEEKENPDAIEETIV